MVSQATMSRSRIKTWADGFGRWYAAVPGDLKDPRGAARRAIRAELKARGDTPPVLRVEPAPDHWLTTDRSTRPVFREAS
jgi:hypothetical protein